MICCWRSGRAARRVAISHQRSAISHQERDASALGGCVFRGVCCADAEPRRGGVYPRPRASGTTRSREGIKPSPTLGIAGSFESGHARAFARMTRVCLPQTRAATPRPAAHTSQSRHAIPTPASCGLGLGRPDTGQLVLGRPCGPPESRVTGGILPPSARARWTTREPGILARLPSIRTRYARAQVTVLASVVTAPPSRRREGRTHPIGRPICKLRRQGCRRSVGPSRDP